MAEGRCAGCREGNRQLQLSDQPACKVFVCAESRGIESCNVCKETTCVLRRAVETICPLRGSFEKQRWWAGRMSRFLSSRKGSAIDAEEEKMSDRVVTRLRWYLVALDALASDGSDSVSSWQLAEKVGVSAALIRKDLSRFGDFGTPSYGYKISFLQERIKGILRLDRTRGVAWVGACALRHHQGALDRLGCNNCYIVGLFDIDEHEIGGSVSGFTVEPVRRMREVLAGREPSVAVIAVPGEQARDVAAELADLGVKAILNLSGELLVLPDHVRVCSLDIAGELLELCYYC